MARVLDLQLQFDSQSIEEIRYEYFHFSESSYPNFLIVVLVKAFSWTRRTMTS